MAVVCEIKNLGNMGIVDHEPRMLEMAGRDPPGPGAGADGGNLCRNDTDLISKSTKEEIPG